MQAEFRMITDISEVKVKELLFNYDELKSFLQDNLAQYKTQVVTPDTISYARADRAKLNKLKDGISAYRISVKKQLMEQYDNDFKPKCDELVSMVDEAASNIGGQIKAFEDAQADEKIASIKAVFDAGDDEVKQFCPWERVYNPKFRNKGFSFDDAKDAVLAEFKKTREDLAAIRTMDTQDIPYLLDIYKQTRDLGKVLVKQNQLREVRDREAKRKAEIEQKRLAQIEEGQEQNIKYAERSETVYVPSAQSEQEEFQEVVFKVYATARQLQSLKGFLRANGIKYGRA